MTQSGFAPSDSTTTNSKRIFLLFQKAFASNSVREKNGFLSEPKRLRKKHTADYSAAILESERFGSSIAEVKANSNKANE
jgi:hypothetical protein